VPLWSTREGSPEPVAQQAFDAVEADGIELLVG
jgi:hypothetical protein